MLRFLGRVIFLGFALTSMCTATQHQATALETVVSEDFCHIEGLNRPLRQTIIVLDQNIIMPASGPNIGTANRQWLNNILTIVGVQEGQASAISAPRERITVLVARSDGGELIRVFTGCPPTYSQSEKAKLSQNDGGIKGTVDWFFGKGLQTKIENQIQKFRTKLTLALSELPNLTRNTPASNSAANTGAIPAFLQAFALFAGTIDLSEGIPRVFVMSTMNAPGLRSAHDAKTARQLGFEWAEKINGDLQRAEVYVTGVSSDSGKYVRDFSHAFFLGIKGRLSGSLSTETLPAVAPEPKHIQIFGGEIEYGRGVKVPMQIRLATDQSGSLINSWVEVTVKRATATPLTGKMTVPCSGEDCKVTADGKEFSQSWVIDPSADQMKNFDENLPFSGLRYFEFTISGGKLKGKIYDPLVTAINGRQDLPFELSRAPNIRF